LSPDYLRAGHSPCSLDWGGQLGFGGHLIVTFERMGRHRLPFLGTLGSLC
jgi:hypothetical protein